MQQVHLLVEVKHVAKVSTAEISADADRVIDDAGFFLAPGLVDPQVHFREPGMEYKEDIESGSRAAVKGGVTAVISMPNTSPTADNTAIVAKMWRRAQQIGLCKVYPTAAVTVGVKGESLTDFASLKAAGAIAFTDSQKQNMLSSRLKKYFSKLLNNKHF